MIRFNRVGKRFGGTDVLHEVTCEIGPGTKTGLIGRNGAGKTTFLQLLLGEEEPTEGVITGRDSLRVGYVPQVLTIADDTLLSEFLLREHMNRQARLREQEEKLALVQGTDLDRELQRYQKILDEYQAAGGDELAQRAATLLDSLGLEGRLDQQVGTLSGGEQNVAGLARALLLEPELLVLDEPGNHLDYQGLAWLEEFLSEFRGAVLVVSHNRYLLDRVAGRILEVEGGTLTTYSGNYSQYRMAKLRKLTADQADYVANQKRLTRLEELVKRFEQIARATADPKWGKRLRSRRSQLSREKAQAVDRPELDQSQIALQMSTEKSRADIALQVNGYNRSIGELELFSEASVEIGCGQRVALIGPNGCGKTTLIRDIVAEGGWDHQILRVGPSMKVGYCAQHQETLPETGSILDYMINIGAGNRSRVFTILSRYLFGWDDLEKNVRDLSGGERNRLQLASFELSSPNFLILDEPTNHMDVFAREAIEDALVDFDGTILVVTHDRYFLEKLETTVVEVKDRKLEQFDGGFSEFWQQRRRAHGSGRTAGRGRARRQPEKTRSEISPARARELEDRIARLEAERGELEALVTQAFGNGDHREGRRVTNRLEQLGRTIDRLYEEWEGVESP